MGSQREDIRKVIAETLGRGIEEVPDEAALEDDLCVDSLDAIEMIMNLEEAYDVQIYDWEASEVRNVGDIIDFLKDRLPRERRISQSEAIEKAIELGLPLHKHHHVIHDMVKVLCRGTERSFAERVSEKFKLISKG